MALDLYIWLAKKNQTMRKLFVTLFTIAIGTLAIAQDDPVIMTIDGKDVKKSEFLQIYLKNNNDPKYDKETLDDYVDLFVKFKLKVAAAEDLGYDTIPRLLRELEGYKKQLALPYLIDSAKNEALVKEAYNRTIKETRASHILIKVEPNASPKDTLAAYNRIAALKKRIENGEDFKTVAMSKDGSEDPSVMSNGGDLGYFSAFQMVYPFEDQAYKTKVGEVSDIFRTRFGYHILTVTDRRDARGVINASHIMVSIPRNAPQDQVELAEKKINEIYDLLQKGEKFEDLVTKYSDDPSSNKKNGQLPIFGTGTATQMVPDFENAAFALENDGDYSKPVRTNYGFHIIRRNNWTPVASFDEMEKELKNRVAKDVRAKETQNSFVQKLKKEYKFKKKSQKNIDKITSQLDSSYFIGQFKAAEITSNKVLFILDKVKYTQQDFAKYLEQNYRTVRSSLSMDEVVSKQYEKWEKETILGYEESKLIEKYPAYKALTTEYHDGILLYEVMKDKVWDKAMLDTVGLKEYYNNNTDKFMWGKRIDADVYECYSRKSADSVYHLLNDDKLSKDSVIAIINNNSSLNLTHRAGKFDLEKTRFTKGQSFDKGMHPIYEVDGKFYVVNVLEVLDPSVKDFRDAKGAVTSEYQNYLEEQWLKDLKAKYSVTINKEVLYALDK